MRRLVLLILIPVLMNQVAKAQNYYHLIAEAYKDYEGKDYRNALKVYEAALKLPSSNPDDIYNAACSAALCGEGKKAVSLLKNAVSHGFNDINHIQEDSDLASLRAQKNWDQIYVELKELYAQRESSYNTPVRKELLQILRDDQDIRSVYVKYIAANDPKSPRADTLRRQILHIDSVNQKKVIAIIEENGWVGNKEVGTDASAAVFLVVQHADVTVQKKYFPLLETQVEKGNANPSYMALMRDRILVNDGKKQIYGTQIGTDDKTGKKYLFPLEDPDHVDTRREEVGLGPIREYLKHWGISFDN